MASGFCLRTVVLLSFCHVFASSEVSESSEQRFLIPVFNSRRGANNLLIELISMVVISRVLNRTFCLPLLPSGPTWHELSHSQQTLLGHQIGDRYNLSQLSRYVSVASLEDCMKPVNCNGTIDVFLKQDAMHWEDSKSWEKKSKETILKRLVSRTWSSSKDVKKEFGNEKRRCVAMGGYFPGLRWRGAFLGIGPFLRHTDMVVLAAREIRKLAFGSLEPYVAVHWRFWESGCSAFGVGRCFLRCAFGSNPASPEVRSSDPMWKTSKSCKGKHLGVVVELADVSRAMRQLADESGVSTIWLATDGWLRTGGCAFIKTVVQSLRDEGYRVAGLWECPDIPGFKDGPQLDNIGIGKEMGLGPEKWSVGNTMISLVEQEICSHATVFMGTGVSSWSVAVHRIRLSLRRAKRIRARMGWLEEPENFSERQKQDDYIIEELMKDDFSAGVTCVARYEVFHHFVKKENAFLDDTDKWLDDMACEEQAGKGGNCSLAQCF